MRALRERPRKGRGTPPSPGTSQPSTSQDAWSVSFLDAAVVAEVEAWPIRLRAALDRIVARIETQGLMSLTEEHAKHLRGRIWELRARADGSIGRALYVTVTGRRLIIVLCAIKKTQATPKRWIELAEARAQDLDIGGSS